MFRAMRSAVTFKRFTLAVLKARPHTSRQRFPAEPRVGGCESRPDPSRLDGTGGYVVCGVHNLQPEVPPENVVAMYEAALEYGKSKTFKG